MDFFAHVHGQDESEPAGAEVGAGLDPGNKDTKTERFIKKKIRNGLC